MGVFEACLCVTYFTAPFTEQGNCTSFKSLEDICKISKYRSVVEQSDKSAISWSYLFKKSLGFLEIFPLKSRRKRICLKTSLKVNMMGQMWNSQFWKCASFKLAFFLTVFVLCFFFLLCDKNRWVLLQERVGHLEKPFRISLEYIAVGNQSVAAIDSFAMKNCSTGKGTSFLLV